MVPYKPSYLAAKTKLIVMMLDPVSWKKFVIETTDADTAQVIETVQSLWSGYGEILRVQLRPQHLGTLIAKVIAPDRAAAHPRGWDNAFAAQRKLRSYAVEDYFYSHWSVDCNDKCRVAKCIGTKEKNNNRIILLEDLDAAGFAQRRDNASIAEAKQCLHWLAHFHAQFMQREPTGLWPTGTYWHLATRPLEFENLPTGKLRDSAARIDQILNSAQYQTIVHGDAKIANFCFSDAYDQVAAVDFQYVGGGCGMKDVAYFIGSAFNERECEQYETELLNAYFSYLRQACRPTNIDADELEDEWRNLYPIAWTDFYRFLCGWVPDHPKINRYSEQKYQQTLSELGIRDSAV